MKKMFRSKIKITIKHFLLIGLFLLFSAPLVFLYVGFLLTNTPIGMTAADKSFVEIVESKLSVPGDRIKVVEAHPGSWIKVCLITAYERPSRVGAQIFGLPRSEIKFLNSSDTVASDNLFGFAFLYPPNTIEYLQIHSSNFYAGDSTDCMNPDEATLEVVDMPISQTHMLKLIRQ